MSGRARLLRYALWQTFDFIVERAAAIVIVLGLFLYISHVSLSHSGLNHSDPASLAMLHMIGPQLMKNMIGTTWLVIGLLGVHGISANDRTTGRFRFLFAKPLRADAFYAQAFVINTTLATACMLVAIATLSLWTAAPAGFLREAMAVGASGVVGISGLCFFFSAVWRYDWLATVGLTGAVAILFLNYPGAAWLRFLPPMNVISEQVDNLEARVPVVAGQLVWFVLFGLLCFAAGLVILRRRPLST